MIRVLFSDTEAFFEYINSQNPHIKFTCEPEVNGQLAFLDTKITRKESGSLDVTIYRKPTHTDQYLHFDSHHPISHKLSVIRTLNYRAQTAVTDPEERTKELDHIKGCGMGPWLVLVSPCFRGNVVATYQIRPFLCSLDNLLQKNVIVFFFGNQISKWRSFEKRAIFDVLFTFLVTRKKLQKFLQHISHSHTYTYFAHPIDFFCLTNFEKNTNLSGTVSLWYESWCLFLFAPFWNNQ